MQGIPVESAIKIDGRPGGHLSVGTPPISKVSRSIAREGHRLVLSLIYMEW